jgi:tetratricopeptide (TPR) repeat protein
MSGRGHRHLWCLPALVLFAAMAGSGCRRDDPEDLWYRAKAAYFNGRLAEAEADLARLARVRGPTAAERLLRAEVLRAQGRIGEALAALDDPGGPKRGPEAARLASSRGELEMQRSRFRVAEAELSRAVALDPSRVEARRQLIDLYALQGRPAEIATQARALARSGSLDFSELSVWTLGRREPLDPAQLAMVLGRAVHADPGDRTSRLALAECQRRLGRLDQAVLTLEALPRTDPEARAARARIALDLGDVDGAEALLGGDRDGDDHPALARLRGRLALGRGDAPVAARHFRAALKAAPDDRDSRFGLGQALRLAGDLEAARPHAEAARSRDRLEWLVQGARPPGRRNNPAALQAIGAACLALDRRDEARAWYRLALSYDSDNANLRNALSQIDSEHPARP